MSAQPVRRSPQRAPDRVTDRGRDEGGRHLRVVSETEAPRPVVGRITVTLVVALFAAVFGLVVFQAVLAQSQRRLDESRRELAAQEEQAKVLRLQLAEAQSPDRIAAAAGTRLGMIPPEHPVYLEPSPDDDRRATYDPAEATTTTTAAPTTTTTWYPQTPTTTWYPQTPTTTWYPQTPTTGYPQTSSGGAR